MPTEPLFELFVDNAGEWQWRLVATNEEIIADCGEGYSSKQGAERGIRSVKRAVPSATIHDTTS
ncbi:YegP family protein [Haladaptatus sp. NG-WS-4]